MLPVTREGLVEVLLERPPCGALNRTMAEIDLRLKQMRERLSRIGAGF